MIFDEESIVRQRRNALQASEAVLVQAAIAGVLSKRGGSHFKRLIESLNED